MSFPTPFNELFAHASKKFIFYRHGTNDKKSMLWGSKRVTTLLAVSYFCRYEKANCFYVVVRFFNDLSVKRSRYRAR